MAILWFLKVERNYEPLTVILGGLSIIFFGVEEVIRRKYELKDKKSTKFDKLSIDEILKEITDSSPTDWEVNFSNDAETAIFKKYPNLRIETRHTKEFVHNDSFHEKWANKFPNPNATSYFYYLYLGATRLKEFILISVDGGRALLPLPKSAIELNVEPLRYKVAKIFDRFGTCDNYMNRAGLNLSNQT